MTANIKANVTSTSPATADDPVLLIFFSWVNDKFVDIPPGTTVQLMNDDGTVVQDETTARAADIGREMKSGEVSRRTWVTTLFKKGKTPAQGAIDDGTFTFRALGVNFSNRPFTRTIKKERAADIDVTKAVVAALGAALITAGLAAAAKAFLPTIVWGTTVIGAVAAPALVVIAVLAVLYFGISAFIGAAPNPWVCFVPLPPGKPESQVVVYEAQARPSKSGVLDAGVYLTFAGEPFESLLGDAEKPGFTLADGKYAYEGSNIRDKKDVYVFKDGYVTQKISGVNFGLDPVEVYLGKATLVGDAANHAVIVQTFAGTNNLNFPIFVEKKDTLGVVFLADGEGGIVAGPEPLHDGKAILYTIGGNECTLYLSSPFTSAVPLVFQTNPDFKYSEVQFPVIQKPAGGSAGASLLTVTVQNAKSGGPAISGATMWLTSDVAGSKRLRDAQTGNQATFSNLANGTYYFWAWHPQYKPIFQRAITLGGNLGVTVSMIPYQHDPLVSEDGNPTRVIIRANNGDNQTGSVVFQLTGADPISPPLSGLYAPMANRGDYAVLMRSAGNRSGSQVTYPGPNIDVNVAALPNQGDGIVLALLGADITKTITMVDGETNEPLSRVYVYGAFGQTYFRITDNAGQNIIQFADAVNTDIVFLAVRNDYIPEQFVLYKAETTKTVKLYKAPLRIGLGEAALDVSFQDANGSDITDINAVVWLTDDVDGLNVVAGPMSTNGVGSAIFYVERGGSYFLWMSSAEHVLVTAPASVAAGNDSLTGVKVDIGYVAQTTGVGSTLEVQFRDVVKDCPAGGVSAAWLSLDSLGQSVINTVQSVLSEHDKTYVEFTDVPDGEYFLWLSGVLFAYPLENLAKGTNVTVSGDTVVVCNIVPDPSKDGVTGSNYAVFENGPGFFYWIGNSAVAAAIQGGINNDAFNQSQAIVQNFQNAFINTGSDPNGPITGPFMAQVALSAATAAVDVANTAFAAAGGAGAGATGPLSLTPGGLLVVMRPARSGGYWRLGPEADKKNEAIKWDQLNE